MNDATLIPPRRLAMPTIRRAAPGDAGALPAVECSAGEAFRALPDLAWIADGEVQSARRHRELIAAGLALVAELSGRPVGFLNAEIFGNRLHLWQIAVHADHQGQGIGTRLLRRAIREAAARGLHAMTLTTFREVSWNEPYYRRLGFVPLQAPSGHLRRILADEARAGLPMERRCAMVMWLGRRSRRRHARVRRGVMAIRRP